MFFNKTYIVNLKFDIVKLTMLFETTKIYNVGFKLVMLRIWMNKFIKKWKIVCQWIKHM